MKFPLSKLALITSAAFAVGTVMASPFGTNITISDNNFSGTGWYSDREDQETETNPNTVTQQQWDLEGMFLNNHALTLVGGYDFKNGVTWSDRYTYKSGDIFIDINGDAKYGQAANGGSGVGGASVLNSFGWDYVLDLNFGTMKYDIYSLTSQSRVYRGLDVASSNPWTYASGGTLVTSGLSMSYTSGLTNTYTGFKGDSTNGTSWSTHTNDQHYSLEVDVGFLAGKNATFHYTMECGNDNLMGQAHVPDAGSSALLFGLALTGLVGFRRKLVR